MGGEESEVWMIVDIHCHILYGVDDGSDSEQTSRQIIDIMAQQQITDVIVTPHFRRHMFPHPAEKIEEAYQNLSGYAQTKGIHLYPGCEYHVDHDIFIIFRTEESTHWQIQGMYSPNIPIRTTYQE